MRLAAIVYDSTESQQVDDLIVALARRLKADGFRLAGAVQSNLAVANRNRCDIMLEDLGTGHVIKASQDRGALASGCRLDTQALEESVGLAASSVGIQTDFVIVNRFGKQEAEGRGFRAVIEQAVLLDVPVIVGLNRAHVDTWCDFIGGDAKLLPLSLDAIKEWCVSTVDRACTCQNGAHICD